MNTLKIVNEPKIIINLDVNHLVELYNSGYSVLKLSQKFGVSRDTIYRRLHGAGVSTRDISSQKLFGKDIEKIKKESKRLYEDELRSTGEIADKLGISSSFARLILKESGVTLDRRSLAKNRERKKLRCIIGKFEDEIAWCLEDFNITRQKAINGHNVDFFIHGFNIVVEVERRGLFKTKSMQKKRLESIACGCDQIIIIFLDRQIKSFDFSVIKGKLISALNILRRDKPDRGHYWVIRCDSSNNLSAFQLDTNHIPFVKRPETFRKIP